MESDPTVDDGCLAAGYRSSMERLVEEERKEMRRWYGNGNVGVVLQNDEQLTFLATSYPHLFDAFTGRHDIFEAFLRDAHDPRQR